jgi:hypothetical protein
MPPDYKRVQRRALLGKTNARRAGCGNRHLESVQYSAVGCTVDFRCTSTAEEICARPEVYEIRYAARERHRNQRRSQVVRTWGK